MTDSATTSAVRPQTPHDFTLLQSAGYNRTLLASPLPHIHVPSDIKRDSGIAASFSTADHASCLESHGGASANNAVSEPPQPANVLQDDHAVPAIRSCEPGLAELSPNDRLRLGNSAGTEVQGAEAGVDNVALGDLASDRVGFSQRGSILFSGKRMNTSRPLPRAVAESSSIAESSIGGVAAGVGGESAADAGEAHLSPIPRGERRPSGQTLQAALQAGRVLSVEEMTFSLRVRSMYEHGDEHAADWTAASMNEARESDVRGSFTSHDSTPEPSETLLSVEKTRRAPAGDHATLRSSRMSSVPKEPNELAGGIEDWEDINGQDVDRYGFINQKRISSAIVAGDEARRDGLPRVATRLKAQAEKPRRNHGLRRTVSTTARSSRSLPVANEKSNKDGAVSVHSSNAHKTLVGLPSTNPFRSKDRKAVADASDMLTLPPGLAQVAGWEEGGRTASDLKRRERGREEKWRKMARIESQSGKFASKGGGMRFEFDTSDQKLVQRTWKGIPDRWRATAWHSFLSTSAKKRGVGASDEELMDQFHKLQEDGSADDVQIDMDVPRTISMHIMFRRRYRGGQRLLFRVLHAISLYFPDTGYVQGMASLAATLLCYFEEETAFVMMVRLWQLRGLEQLFASGFEGLMRALEEFERDWLKHGGVAKKLDDLNISSTAYGTRWYLTLFNMSVPFPAQLRVWDVFMLLGDAGSDENHFGGADLDVLHATSAALIDAMREIILDSDFENVMKVLTSFVPITDEDLFMRVAWAEWKQRKKRASKA